MPEIKIGEATGPSAEGWHRLEYYLHCNKKFQLSQVRGIHEAPAEFTPDYFAVGLLHHAMRARWFANNFATTEESWQSIINAGIQASELATAPFSVEAQAYALKLFQKYILHYSARVLPVPVAAEYLIEGKLEESDDAAVKFSARLDDVSFYTEEASGKLCIGESKTCSDINQCIEEYTLHGQPLLQAALWEIAEGGAKKHGRIAGVILDMVRKPQERKTKKGTVTEVAPKFARQFMPINPRVLNWFVEEIREAKGRSRFVTWGSQEKRNISNCTRMYGRARVACQFRQLCMYGRTAAGLYVTKDGQPLNEWQPEYDGQAEPWD